MGGLSRRNSVIAQKRAAGPVVVVDAGDLLWKNGHIPPGERSEREAKARLIAEASEAAKFDAMLPGEGEFAFGREALVALANEFHLPYVVSNLTCETPLPFETERVVERGGVTMAIYGVVSPDLNVDGCRPSDPAPILGKATADVIIVLSGQHEEEDRRLSAKVPHLDFVVNGRDRDQLPAPGLLDHGALRLASGSRGKQLGALVFLRVPGAEGWMDEGIAGKAADDVDHYTKRLDELKARIASEPDAKARERLERQAKFLGQQVDRAKATLSASASTGGQMNKATNSLVDMGADVADDAQILAKVDALKVALSTAPVTPVVAYTGAYVGSDACAGCHAVEAAQWKTTAHASAWATLVNQKRQTEADCWTCHSTGGGRPEGPTSSAAAIHDVGCESCHGAGAAHVATPTTAALVRDPPQTVCVQCHDAKNDMGRFDWEHYRPRVVHQ